jgi:uncharacterized protein with HEPN domain
MSRRSANLLLADILERAERIERHVADMDLKEFVGDEKTIDAVVRNLEVIGEAASRMPSDYRESHSEIPWRRIVGLRNRVIHAYFEVDLELLASGFVLAEGWCSDICDTECGGECAQARTVGCTCYWVCENQESGEQICTGATGVRICG